jgi:hypothetical protein
MEPNTTGKKRDQTGKNGMRVSAHDNRAEKIMRGTENGKNGKNGQK